MEIKEKLEAKASVKNIRVSPRKVRLVLDELRGKNVYQAKAILKNINKSSKTVILKLIDSAVANAVNNNGMDEEKLYIKEIYANEGLKLKRFRPKARGAAVPIIKRTSHIDVVLGQSEEE